MQYAGFHLATIVTLVNVVSKSVLNLKNVYNTIESHRDALGGNNGYMQEGEPGSTDRVQIYIIHTIMPILT